MENNKTRKIVYKLSVSGEYLKSLGYCVTCKKSLKGEAHWGDSRGNWCIACDPPQKKEKQPNGRKCDICQKHQGIVLNIKTGTNYCGSCYSIK